MPSPTLAPVAPGVIAAELADRVVRTLDALLTADRCPDPDTLHAALAPVVGKVLAETKFTRPERALLMKVMGGAATYCWRWLPPTAWTRTRSLTDLADGRPVLMWRNRHEVMADVILAGVQRDPAIPGRAALLELLQGCHDRGVQLGVCRILPVHAPASALVVRLVGGELVTEPLAGSTYEGGLP